MFIFLGECVVDDDVVVGGNKDDVLELVGLAERFYEPAMQSSPISQIDIEHLATRKTKYWAMNRSLPLSPAWQPPRTVQTLALRFRAGQPQYRVATQIEMPSTAASSVRVSLELTSFGSALKSLYFAAIMLRASTRGQAGSQWRPLPLQMRRA